MERETESSAVICHRLCFTAILMLLALATGASAQLPTGTILGTIKDDSGAVMPGVTVSAAHVETGRVRSTASGEDGAYRFSAMPVGRYVLRAELAGFQTAVRQGVSLTIAEEAVINFTLQVGALEESLIVTGDAPLINTTSATLGGLVTEEKIAELPLNGRNYIDLMLLQPGVTQSARPVTLGGFAGSFISSMGAPVTSNNYMLDGASMVTIYGVSSSSTANTTLGLEGIREYRVVTNTPSAEYGMTMGGQIVMASKSGGNTFHGSGFEYHRNSALDARSYFDRGNLPPFVRNNFGLAVGGPIVANKTFFHLTYEGLRERLGLTKVSNVIPKNQKVDGGLVPLIHPAIKPLVSLFPDPNLGTNQYTFNTTQTTNQSFGQIRIDHTFSDANSFFGRYTFDDTAQIRPADYQQISNELSSRGQFLTLSDTHVFSPFLLNMVRVSSSRTTMSGESPGITAPGFTFIEGHPIGRLNIGGMTSWAPDPNNPIRTTQNIYTLSNDVFYTRGSHALKFGFLLNQYQQYMLASTYIGGLATFPNIATFLEGKPSLIRAIMPGSILDRTFRYKTLGFYVQDDLRLASTLTLNLGLRYEFMTPFKEAHGHGAYIKDVVRDAVPTIDPQIIRNNTLKNFSPRVGFAWDVLGNSSTAIRGGFALLHDIGNLGSMSVFTNTSNPPFSTSSQWVNPPTLTLPFTFPTELIGKAVGQLDPDLKQPKLLQFNVAVERQLPARMGLMLAYAGSRGIDLIRTTEGNPYVPQILANGQKFWPSDTTRRNPNWDSIRLIEASGKSWYDSLQVSVLRRAANLDIQSSYTWSKLLDNTQGFNTGGSPMDPFDPNYDKGPANFNLTHQWRLNSTYRLPEFSRAGPMGTLLNGWSMSGILTALSGVPFTPVLTSNRSRSGLLYSPSDRPDLVPGRTKDNIILGGPVRYFDPTAFRIPPAGFLGNSGRNILEGPGFLSVDFAILKNTGWTLLGENRNIEFRAEFFNIFNHTNFGIPAAGVYAGTADVQAPLANVGQITTTANPARQIQFGIKISF